MDMSGHGHEGHAPGSHLGYMCDGTHWTGMAWQRPSNWSTHIYPGIMVLFWALHWTSSVFKLWFTSSKQQPYKARTTYNLPFVPTSWPVEGYVKAGFSFLGIMMQLWWAHGHWSRQVCPEGSLRAGHFVITAVHNWANAWTLFMFMTAGLIDIVATKVQLPPNTQQVMTSAAFGLHAFSLYQGQHQDMLDGMLYYLMFMCTAATSLVMLLEVAQPEAFWVGVFKCYTLWIQGVWYVATGRILFGGSPAWDTLQPVPDMSPAMFVPVVFVMWMNIVALAMLIGYLFCRWWYQAHLNEHLRSVCTVEKTLQPLGARSAGRNVEGARGVHHELVPLVARV